MQILKNIFLLGLLINVLSTARVLRRSIKTRSYNANPLFFEQIMKIFQLPKKQSTGKYIPLIEDSIDVSTWKLLYPATMDLVKVMKRCVVSAKFKGSSKMVAIKIETDEKMRSSYNKNTYSITCGKVSKNGPLEPVINKLMNNAEHFVKYFEKNSGWSPSKIKNQRVLFYTNEYLDGSVDLEEWTRKNIKSMPMNLYEYSISYFYNQIYTALNQLRNKGFIYTDLKPANILIDSKNNAYLIDLESVIRSTNKQVCVFTQVYFPPDVQRNSLQGDRDMERILSWTFCNSIYTSACSMYSQTKYNDWMYSSKSFLEFFGCSNRISSKLNEFLGKCLVKVNNSYSFSNLKTLDWLNVPQP